MGKRKTSYCGPPVECSPPEDLSVQREPLNLGTEGVTQLIQCMQSGTTELRNLLQHECSIILECKVCRALFRGLPNFIAHKRVYCRDMKQHARLQVSAPEMEEETVVVQPDSPPGDVQDAHDDDDNDQSDPGSDSDSHQPGLNLGSQSNSNFESGDDGESQSNGAAEDGGDQSGGSPHGSSQNPTEREAKTVLEQMKQGSFVGSSSAYSFYTDVVERTLDKQKTKTTSLLKLELLKGTSKAMQLSLKQEVSPSEVDVYFQDQTTPDMMEMTQPELGPQPASSEAEVVSVEPKEATGHIHMSLRTRSEGAVATPIALKLRKRDDCDIRSLTCLLCDMQYSSMKTLHFHMVSLHSEKRTFYPCPICKITFAQTWGVARHLMKHHKKTKEQVDKMRESLKRLSFSKSVEQMTAERPLSKLDESKSQSSLALFKCDKCNKGFGKKWFLEKHLVNCQAAGDRRERSTSCDSRASGSLQNCNKCGEAFGKKSQLAKHMESCECEEEISDCESDMSAAYFSDNVSLVSATSCCSEKTEVSSSHSKSGHMSMWKSSGGIKVKLSAEDLKKVESMIDEDSVMCLRCQRQYGSISNLHRHAVRHLGWRRYKCRLCRYTAYNRSECKSHLSRVHTVKDKSKYDNYILDLSDRMAMSRNAMPRVEMQYTRHSRMMKAATPEAETSSTYNISTRNNPRKFNLEPVKRVEPMQVLCTRSSVYRKPTFEQLVGHTSKSSSPASDGEHNDELNIRKGRGSRRKRKQNPSKIQKAMSVVSVSSDEEQLEDDPVELLPKPPPPHTAELPKPPPHTAITEEKRAIDQLEIEHGYNSPAHSDKPESVDPGPVGSSKDVPKAVKSQTMKKTSFSPARPPRTVGSPLRPRILRRSNFSRKASHSDVVFPPGIQSPPTGDIVSIIPSTSQTVLDVSSLKPNQATSIQLPTRLRPGAYTLSSVGNCIQPATRVQGQGLNSTGANPRDVVYLIMDNRGAMNTPIQAAGKSVVTSRTVQKTTLPRPSVQAQAKPETAVSVADTSVLHLPTQTQSMNLEGIETVAMSLPGEIFAPDQDLVSLENMLNPVMAAQCLDNILGAGIGHKQQKSGAGEESVENADDDIVRLLQHNNSMHLDQQADIGLAEFSSSVEEFKSGQRPATPAAATQQSRDSAFPTQEHSYPDGSHYSPISEEGNESDVGAKDFKLLDSAVVTEPSDLDSAVVTEPSDLDSAVVTEPSDLDSAVVTEPSDLDTPEGMADSPVPQLVTGTGTSTELGSLRSILDSSVEETTQPIHAATNNLGHQANLATCNGDVVMATLKIEDGTEH